jgi:tRNA threonylcarbamoyladenosine biosynthesis protein TsaB
MKILAIDTATEACSAALLWNDAVLTREQVSPQGHTRIILPMVSELLAEAGASLQELDAIAFGGANVPLIAVSTLQMLAQGAYRRHQAETVVSAIDARMNEIYLGAFTLQDGRMLPLLDEAVILPEQAAEFLHSVTTKIAGGVAVGTGFTSYTELAAQLGLSAEDNQLELNLPWAQDLLPQAVAAYQAGDYCDPSLATPVYLRDKVTWKKLPGRE